MTNLTDMTFLDGFTGGNADKKKKYISMFLQLCPSALDSMKASLDQQDYDALRATAHSLKPQITYMGIKAGEPMVKDIEHWAGQRVEVEKLPALFSEFDQLCRQAMEELRQRIA